MAIFGKVGLSASWYHWKDIRNSLTPLVSFRLSFYRVMGGLYMMAFAGQSGKSLGCLYCWLPIYTMSIEEKNWMYRTRGFAWRPTKLCAFPIFPFFILKFRSWDKEGIWILVQVPSQEISNPSWPRHGTRQTYIISLTWFLSNGGFGVLSELWRRFRYTLRKEIYKKLIIGCCSHGSFWLMEIFTLREEFSFCV